MGIILHTFCEFGYVAFVIDFPFTLSVLSNLGVHFGFAEV
jgi:hypothetical protein